MITIEDSEIIKTFKPSGQKQVYLVNIESMQMESVILKIGKASSKTSLDRVIREVNIQEELDSHYFPKNFHLDFDRHGNFVIIEEFIDAPQLRECIDDFADEESAIALIIEIIKACSLLWDKRVVHRDMKPENILIADKKPVIIDLGIARALDEETLTNMLQRRGPCTPIYAAPEQLNNNIQHIDHRTDIFQIGIILAELILKIHPFHPSIVGEGMGIVENILNGKYGNKNGEISISKSLSDVINNMLASKKYDRYRDYNQCILDLGAV